MLYGSMAIHHKRLAVSAMAVDQLGLGEEFWLEFAGFYDF